MVGDRIRQNVFRVVGRAGERAPDRNGLWACQPDLTKLVPYATLAFMRGDAPQLSSGTRLVDWVYVDDVVDALVRTAETDTTIGRGFRHRQRPAGVRP